MRLVCDCGYVAEATNEDDVVALAQLHAGRVHGMLLTAQQLLMVAREHDVRARRAM